MESKKGVHVENFRQIWQATLTFSSPYSEVVCSQNHETSSLTFEKVPGDGTSSLDSLGQVEKQIIERKLVLTLRSLLGIMISMQ